MSPLLIVLLLVPAALIGVVLAGLWSAGRFLNFPTGRPATALPLGMGSALDYALAPAEQGHPGQSGALLVPDPHEALAHRLAMVAGAGRSVDLLYYMWNDDLAGNRLSAEILASADRGVRVRMLLDDVNVLGRDPAYRALDKHPRIEVRLFNPVRSRDRGLKRGLELLFNLMPLNRRMHGKLMIADGRLMITGGRNIGDEYFGLGGGTGHDYTDLDILMAGAVLRQAEELFDAFWNSGIAQPIRRIAPVRGFRLRRYRRRLRRRLAAPGAEARLGRALPETPALPDPSWLHWGDTATFVGDPPHKALDDRRHGWMPEVLLPLLSLAQTELRILTPYFVPGPQGLATLCALAERGVRVQIVTNALMMADNPFVHGAYAWYRRRLLAAGVEIYEVAPRTRPRLMLHAKAFLVDGQHGFVGSFNFDMRSAFLNTETGVILSDAPVVADLAGMIDAATGPDVAYRLALQDGRLCWTRPGEAALFREPHCRWWRRAITGVVGHLPIHRFL